MKKLFLFDMDGTLTPARKKMEFAMLRAMARLQSIGWDIGIISGSDMHYIEQQCGIMFDISPIDCKSIHFLPCNGTKYYKSFKKIWQHDMTSKLGNDFMTEVYKSLLKYQGNIIALHPKELPLTGNFFQMRGSVLNWCPIGRNAKQNDREKFIRLDKKAFIREWFIGQFKSEYDPELITIKLGGETSFDIYPKGWNKTFPIEKDPFKSYDKIYFAGDRCEVNGNDKELYDYLKNKKYCDAFHVANPSETINIIQKF